MMNVEIPNSYKKRQMKLKGISKLVLLPVGTPVLLTFIISVNAQQCIDGDLNCDGAVDVFDLVIVATDFGKTSGFDPRADPNQDGKVNLFDLVVVATNFGKGGGTTCECSSWTNDRCGAGTCTQSQMRQTRACNPSSCEVEESCLYDPSCGSVSSSGIWISPERLAGLPTSGSGWNNVYSAAQGSAGTPDLSNQDDDTNVKIMAKALVCARKGEFCSDVEKAIESVASASYSGRALALGRELAAYVISADLINLEQRNPVLDSKFRSKIKTLLTTPTSEGPANLIKCQEDRPNNWGTHCGASRAAVYSYLGDKDGLERVAKVFKGWLGDRSSYAGFSYGCLAWQCDENKPVGVNPKGCTKQGHNFDGVLPDDQRRWSKKCVTKWPPPKENYVWEGLQGALAQAVILHQAGYDVWNWEDMALLRAVTWIHEQANYPAEGDDTWQPWIVNYYYGSNFPSSAARSGKNIGWTDWTHQ